MAEVPKLFRCFVFRGEGSPDALCCHFLCRVSYDDSHRFFQRVQASMDANRLAALVANSGLLAEVIHSVDWLPRISEVESDTAEKMLLALVGAYVEERGGDFNTVTKVWEWLTAHEQKETGENEKFDNDDLKRSIRYVGLEATKIKGRTPTYERFSQVVDPEDGTLELHVKYEELGIVYCRRADVQKKRPNSQYKLENSPEKGWMPIQYDHRQETYVWRAFRVHDSQENYFTKQVSKMVARHIFCRSQPLKRCGASTLVHEPLCEKKDGSLHIEYKDHGLFR